jgi:hypothetical protein
MVLPKVAGDMVVEKVILVVVLEASVRPVVHCREQVTVTREKNGWPTTLKAMGTMSTRHGTQT